MGFGGVGAASFKADTVRKGDPCFIWKLWREKMKSEAFARNVRKGFLSSRERENHSGGWLSAGSGQSTHLADYKKYRV